MDDVVLYVSCDTLFRLMFNDCFDSVFGSYVHNRVNIERKRGVNMFVLKIATTVWLTLIAFGMVNTALNKKVTVSTRLLSIAVMFGQILAIAFMWQ
jgi:hypothetical protein